MDNSNQQEINTLDRVRSNTGSKTQQKIDLTIQKNVNQYSQESKNAISKRIKELEKEWSIERRIETFASTLIVSGTLLGAFSNKKWLFLPGVVAGFLLQHGVQGWCPPVPLFRSLGVRTRKEIDWEKFSLKMLRGDFENIVQANPNAVLEAVKKV